MRSTRHLARVSMCPELLLLVLAVVTADAGGKNRNGHDADHVQGNLPTNLAAIDGELSRGNTLGPVETLERLGHDGMGGTSYGTGSVSKLMIGGEPIHSTSLRRFVYAAYDPLAIWAAIMGTIWLFLSILWCVRRSSLPRRPTERERSLEPFFEFWPAAMANPWPSWTFKYLPTSASTGSSTPNGPEYYHGGKPLFRESITGIPGRETEVVPLSVLTEGPGFNVSVNLFRCFLTVWLCSSAFAGIPMYLLPFPNEFPIGIVAPILALVFAAIWAIYLDCLDPAVMVRGLEHGAECMTEIEVSSFLESLQGEWDVTMEFKVESRNTLVSPVGGTTAQSAPPHGDSRAEVEVLDGKVHVDNAGGAVCLTFRGVPANALRRQRKLLRQYPADYAATEMEVSGDVPYRMNLLLFRGPTGRVYADNIGTRISVSDDRSTVLIDQHDFEWDVPLAAGKGLLRKTILCQTNLILTRSEPRAGVEVGQLTGEVLGRLQPSAPPSVSELSAQVQIPRETANEPMAIDPSSISPRMDPFPSSEIRLLREEMQMMRREASSSKAQHDMELGALHEEIRVLRQELRVLGGAPADTASDTTESSGAALQPRAMAESSSTLTRPRPTTSHQSPITAHHEEYSHRVRGAPSLRPLNPLGRVDGRGAQHTLAVTPPPAQVVNDNPVEPGEPGDGDAQGKSVTYPGLKLT
jgi:hypothetical protein